jgi:uncharacterized membrane protein YdbT with pleckstrin-like domain
MIAGEAVQTEPAWPLVGRQRGEAMSYLDHVLQPGEKILYRTTVSWTLFFPGIALLIVAIIVYGLASTAIPLFWANILFAIIGLPALFLLFRAWFARWTTEIAVTNSRIILKRGFIRRHTIEMHMDKVESVDVDQSLLGRLLNYGNITVRGTGAGFEPLHMIDHPLRFRSHVIPV